MQDTADGVGNTIIGYYAGTWRSTGDYNTCIGHEAGRGATAPGDGSPATGDGNTCVGRGAGEDLRSGDNNLLLGRDAGKNASPSGTVSTHDNKICLGNNSITDAYILVDWTVTSDRRDKTDIEPFNHGLSWINKLNPVTYRWDMRSNYEDGKPDGSKKASQLNVGLIAQDELDVEKEHGYGDTVENMLVSHINPGGNYGMQYSKLVPILINAVKELSAQNEALVARITALESN